MIPTATLGSAPRPRPHRKRRLSKRTVLVAGGIVAALVAIPALVNEVTPRPYDAIFKFLIGQVDSSVQLGSYADTATETTESDPIAVAVDGAPDATLTMYTSNRISDEPQPVILLIHGGGWVVGAASQISDYARLLASEGFVVANLDYSLAPDFEYPTPVLQSVAALDYLATHADEFGGDPTQLFVAGNSAGAQISSQVGAVVTNPAFASTMGIEVQTPGDALRGVVLYSGPYDFDTIERDNFPGWRAYAWSYVGQKDWQNYARLDELSTVKNVTSRYPATYMTSGDADPLEPQTYEFDAVLRAEGVDVTSRYWTGSDLALPHDYVFDLRTDAARTAFDDTVAFVRSRAK
jgi:acetyl esterase